MILTFNYIYALHFLRKHLDKVDYLVRRKICPVEEKVLQSNGNFFNDLSVVKPCLS